MPVTSSYAYFDHAAVAPLPARSRDAMLGYAEEACTHGDAIWPKWATKIRELRQRGADLLGAKTDEIALVNSTTQGINIVAEGFPWEPGDNLLVPENEFPSNMVPWFNLQRCGVEVRTVPVPESGVLTADAFRPLIDQKTRLIALSWVGYSTGFRIDVGQIVEMARSGEKEILVALDAIQGLGAFALDAKEVDVDFVCADGHKWMLGPEGAGLFYLKQEHLNLLRPVGLGWNSLASGGFEPLSTSKPLQESLKKSAARYEGGTSNLSGVHGLGASLDVLLEAGLNHCPSLIGQQILENVAVLEQELQANGFQAKLPAEEIHRSGILGVVWEEAPSVHELNAARDFLLENKIVTSVRGGCLRISTHAYNNEEDISRLIHHLVEFRTRQRS